VTSVWRVLAAASPHRSETTTEQAIHANNAVSTPASWHPAHVRTAMVAARPGGGAMSSLRPCRLTSIDPEEDR
jgi:hypothetical protein